VPRFGGTKSLACRRPRSHNDCNDWRGAGGLNEAKSSAHLTPRTESLFKVKEHGLTFPVVLQRHWEISRSYNMYATPIAYLIDETGVILHDVAVGENAILELLDMAGAKHETAPLVRPA
jgi:hypothetical protein